MTVSEWRNDGVWGARLSRDLVALREAVGQEKVEYLGQIVTALDDKGGADFLVAFGSRAAGRGRPDSDLDLYFEAVFLAETWAHHEDEVDLTFEGLGSRSGTLLGELRAGNRFAFCVIRDARVFVDRGAFREALIAVDEEGLVAAGEHEQKGGDAGP